MSVLGLGFYKRHFPLKNVTSSTLQLMYTFFLPDDVFLTDASFLSSVATCSLKAMLAVTEPNTFVKCGN